MKKPGVSITFGLTQGSHTPYAAVKGTLGPLTARKRIKLGSNLGLGLLGAVTAAVLSKSEKEEAKEPSIENPFLF